MSTPKLPSTHVPATPELVAEVDPRAQRQTLRRRELLAFFTGLSAAAPLAALTWRGLGDSAGTPPAAATPPEPTPESSPRAPGMQERPRLLFVIPAAPSQAEEDQETDAGGERIATSARADAGLLGHALGEYLQHASDQALAPLALVHMECVHEKDVTLPAHGTGSGPYALLLVSRESTRLVRFSLAELGRGIAWRTPEGTQQVERLVDERIAAVSGAVHTAVLPDGLVATLWNHIVAPASLDALLEENQASRHSSIRALLARSAEDTSEPPPSDSDLIRWATPAQLERKAPALTAYALAHRDGEVRDEILARLGQIARKRLVSGRVHGADWAQNHGCGTKIEDHEQSFMFGCGMGHVPERSQRFLTFYSSSF